MALLEIENLEVSFRGLGKTLTPAVKNVSFKVEDGESLGIVGESGSGKSVSCMAALRLLRAPAAQIQARKLMVAGTDMLKAPPKERAALRGKTVAMVFQDPMSAFDPSFTIGAQIAETIQTHEGLSRKAAHAEAADWLARMRIRTPNEVAQSHPFQLSGGMLQRAMIAMALCCKPRLLIADEPTTALDVTLQARILELIKDLQAEFGMALVMITHDLGVIAETVDNVVVMYRGEVLETAPVEQIFDAPAHPYTRSLLAALHPQIKEPRYA